MFTKLIATFLTALLLTNCAAAVPPCPAGQQCEEKVPDRVIWFRY